MTLVSLPLIHATRLYPLSIAAERALKLVEYAVVLVQVAQFSAEVIVDVDFLDGCFFVPYVPDLEGEVVAGKDVLAIFGEFDIRN